MKNIRIFKNPAELGANLANELVSRIENHPAIAFNLAISGGKTPEIFFHFLAEKMSSTIQSGKLHFWWVDERMVPQESTESNFGRFSQIFLSEFGFHESNIHRIKGEMQPEVEMLSYTAQMQQNLMLRDDFPIFDLILLGLGNDGHTASIFPDRMDLLRTKNICEITAHPLTGQKRITLTGKTINNAKEIIFIVSGIEKAEQIVHIFTNSEVAQKLPAAHIQPVSGNLWWYIDQAAAQNLPL
jgi:6-phosphogluconolactonase